MPAFRRKLGRVLIACLRVLGCLFCWPSPALVCPYLSLSIGRKPICIPARQALARHDFPAAHREVGSLPRGSPQQRRAHLLLARLDRRGNQYVEAAKHLDECQRLAGSADAIELERALLSIQKGVFDARLERICRERLVPGGAEEYFILEALSQGLSKTYRLAEAKTCLDRMLELQPDSGYALRRRGWIFSLTYHNDRGGRLSPCPGSRSRGYGRAAGTGSNRRRPGGGGPTFRARVGSAQGLYDSCWSGSRLGTRGPYRGSTPASRQLVDRASARCACPDRTRQTGPQRSTSQTGGAVPRRALAVAPYLRDANHALSLCLNQQGKKAEAEQCQARIKQFEKDNRQMVDLTVRLQRNPNDADLRCRMAEIFLPGAGAGRRALAAGHSANAA